MARSTNLIIPEVTEAAGLRRLLEKRDVFNAASNGTMLLEFDTDLLDRIGGGDHIEPIQLTRPSGIDTHVDEANPTSTVSPVRLAQAKGATVFQKRKGYMSVSDDERDSGKFTDAQYSIAIGEAMADDMLVKLRENLIGMGLAAIDSMDTTDGSTASADLHILNVARQKTAGGAKTASFARLNQLLSKIGDARENITTFIMHSAVFADLVGDSISNYKIENVGGVSLVRDVIQAFGRSVMMIDSSNMQTSLTSTYYKEYETLALGPGALRVKIIKMRPPRYETPLTTEVVSESIRQDYTVEYAVQGMKWVTAGTNVNPTDAELKTAARWDEFYSDHREALLLKLNCNVTQ